MTTKHSHLLVGLAILAVTVLLSELESLLRWLPGYLSLFDRFGYAVPRSLLSALQVLLALAAVCWLARVGPRRGGVELGLRRPVLVPVLFALGATAPMWLVFAALYPVSHDLVVMEVLYLALVSPVAEEVVYRGFAFGQLRHRAGWPFWLAAAVPAALFGWGHAEGADTLAAGAGLFALTAIGALVFTWLYVRWNTLIAPIGIHVLMNLCWNVWNVGDSALAGWLPFALQVAVIGTAIGLTVGLSERFRHHQSP